jgi:hypothetical protein
MAKRMHQQREDHLRLMEKSLADGNERAEVVRAAATKFGVSKQQARADLRGILTRWQAVSEEHRQRKQAECCLARAMLRRNRIFKTALASGDLRIALETEKDICQLAGLYPAACQEISSPDGQPIQAAVGKVIFYDATAQGQVGGYPISLAPVAPTSQEHQGSNGQPSKGLRTE